MFFFTRFSILFIVVHCCSFSYLHSQTENTTLEEEFPTIQVMADVIKLTDKAEKSIIIAPIQKGMSLSQALQHQSSFYIKQYGLGGLSTISHQGNTASQTELLWEGIPIHNPMLGQTDLNLQALFLVDKITLKHQDTEAILSGNALNTSVNLSSQRIKHTQISALYSIGQFNQHRLGVDLNFVKGSFASRSRIFGIHAKNNFKYKDINAFGSTKPIVHMPNNEQKQIGIAQDFYYDFSALSALSIKLFAQISDRQLPPTLLQNNSTETQKDSTFRIVITYDKRDYSNKSFIKISQAFVTESLLYTAAGVESYSAFLQSNTNAFWKYKFNAQKTLQIQGQYQYLLANNENSYAKSPFQNRIALSALYKWQFKKFMWDISARAEAATNNKFLYAVSSNLTYAITEKLNVHFFLAKQYRLPTFNDLYWAIGGNPNLIPEQSYQTNIMLNYIAFKHKKQQLSLGLMPYASYTENQIYWLPSENSSIWTAMNLKSVKNYGIHANINYNVQLNKDLFVLLSGQYSFMRVIQENYPNAQFFYTPKHNAIASLRLSYKQKLNLDYTHQYTSVRFIDNVNTRFLPSFNIANLSINYIYTALKQQYTMAILLNNLYNTDYQIMANRPMPKAWLALQLQVTFLGKEKNFK